MAGFIHHYNSKNSADSKNWLNRIRSVGVNLNSKAFKHSQTVGINDVLGKGFTPATADIKDGTPNNAVNNITVGGLSYGGTSYGMGAQDSIYTMPYCLQKRNILRQMSAQDEIEEVLDIVCDETIWFGDNARFCELMLPMDSVKENIRERAMKIFEDVYNMYGFSESNLGWHKFRKFLVDGYLAYEIVYDNPQQPKKITGLKEIDPLSLEKMVDPETGEITYRQSINTMSGLSLSQNNLDNRQIVFLSYSNMGSEGTQRCSYVERLVRSYNLLRIAEGTRIVWSVSNATFRTRFTVPVEQASTRGRQTLGQLMQQYHEDVSFNWDSGEMRTNGNAMLPFSKEYWFPSVNGARIEMDTVGQDGPPLNDTDLINYLRNKFRQTSKVPIIRFDKEQGMGAYALNAEGIRREEIKFSNFKNRLRMLFQELLIKPVMIQLALDFPAIESDNYLKNSVKIHFFDDTSFEEQAACERMEKRSQSISTLLNNISVKDSEGNDMPYFDLDFLIKKYSGLSQADIDENESFKERKALKAEGYKDADIEKILAGADKKKFKKGKPEKQAEASGGEGGGAAGGGGEPAGGGEPGGGEPAGGGESTSLF